MTLEEFEHRLTHQKCWLDGAPTHESHSGQRQCRSCRRKWSYKSLQRHWRLAQLFCAPSGKAAEYIRDQVGPAGASGSAVEFRVPHPAKELVNRVHAAVLLREGDRVAGRKIARTRKRAINAAAVGRVYSEFEEHMVVHYIFHGLAGGQRARERLLENAGIRVTSASLRDEGAVLAALRRIAGKDRGAYQRILEFALQCLWEDEVAGGGYRGRLAILHRRFFVPRLAKLGVAASDIA
jgi:hypothetical protein